MSTKPSNSTVNIFGYNVFNKSLNELNFSSQIVINTFSPNSYGVAKSDDAFDYALKNTDVLVLDGMGIAIGSILLHGKNIKKIAGQDCFDFFTSKFNETGGNLFFMGSTNSTLEKIKCRMNNEYPNIKVGYFSPPFKETFSEVENNEIISAINEFKPDVVFVGLTAPKQEKWAFYNKEMIDAKIISTIGNVFDWYAGNSKRPSKFWIKLRLEWLVRIFLRPEILQRNTKNQMIFFKDLILHVLYIKRIKY